VYRQRKLIEKDARGLECSRKSAKKVKGHHKTVARATEPFVFTKHRDRSKVHRHTAKLKGELAPGYRAALDNVK
jgi:hypothetical protein